MAEKKVLVNLNLNGNQIINVRAEVAASAPASGTPGRFYFNTTYQKLYVYTTGGWKVVGDDLPNNLVTADNTLTADTVLVGDGSRKAKASSYTIATSVPSGAVFTDEKVKQEATPSTNDNYPIFFSKTNWNSGAARTSGAYIGQYLTYNPSTGTINVSNLAASNSVTVGGDVLAKKNYVDQQDQKLADRISSISGFGRYLSGWDMQTGAPTSLPTTATYTLVTGDYFIITNVPSSGTKYKPNQTGQGDVSQPFAKTATTDSCVVGGYWKYDGSHWSYFAPESAVTLPPFTNSSKGAIQGYDSDGYVYHDSSDAEGRGKVSGWSNKADKSAQHTLSLGGDLSSPNATFNNETNIVGVNATINAGAVTTAKIADEAVTGVKIATDAVDHTKIKAKWYGEYIAASQTDSGPYWMSTGNANEYKAIIGGVTRNGSVRLCESNEGSFNGAKEVECVIEYGEDETGIFSATAYINSATAPTAGQYYFHCRKEFD